ncbi:hypothetical protein CWE04_11810 [Thomasclavelia cocleata]|uniref:Uncharacterized protein n=1 Tax=Thomasclavelia cocleata TaxID=69824 RepID=A0A1I0BJL5_9FIRM|nr:hypothetical protein [Thomasclavelia cocleata]MCR1960211.1 hypothetical protein [Thomasclavelia cocleata]NDO41815.1 hypothetical protein [Thomasclavelia cocleata]PJN79888.1 hypothetical protein CWE04_11810 [Thomasclavelia cocleata]SET07198.1 hypothetical protein SAMN04489758_101154 [Thomasclavelia cocleata]
MNKLQIEHLISKIYKILPLKESDNASLYEYLDSLVIQLEGARKTCTDFTTNNLYSRKYIEIINTVNYLKDNTFTTKQCKREVFKCISLLNSIMNELKDD